MIRAPHRHGPGTTVADLRGFFADEHVHCALIVDGGRLVAVVERADLTGAPATATAADRGRLGDRVVVPDTGLEATRVAMLARGQRRLAVVDGRGRLLGLLCLKRTGLGFCTDADVRARGCGPSGPTAAGQAEDEHAENEHADAGQG